MELHRDAGLGSARSGSRNYDFAIILDFDDEAAFRQYMSREHHHHVVETYIAPYRESAARMQFVV